MLDAEYSDILTSMANLALIYQNQGHQKKTKDLDIQVIKTSLRVLGVKYSFMLISITNLALIYQNQRR